MLTDSEVDISGMVPSGRVLAFVEDEDEEDRDSSGHEKNDEEDDGDINDINTDARLQCLRPLQSRKCRRHKSLTTIGRNTRASSVMKLN